MKKLPLISIIIPNRATEKNESLKSVKEQTYNNIEIIEIIDKDAKGASWARNEGLKKAKGEYLFFCDNDLDLDKDCLSNLYQTLQENKWADWAFGKFIIDRTEFNINKGEMPEDMESKEFIDYFHGISTMSLIRASAKPKFSPDMRRYDDWELWIRLTRAGHKPVFCDKILFKTFNRPGGISTGNDSEKWMKYLYKKHLKKIADIIIPHHDQHELLADCLKTLDNKLFNIIIISGGTFSESCNKGARLAETENLIFLNDDTIPVHEYLMKMVKDDSDITGIAQYIPDRKVTKYGISIKLENGVIVKSLEDIAGYESMPSGFCFKVKKDIWEELGGLDEEFMNGGEDVDFFLRAMQKKKKFGYVRNAITHFLSKSADRFTYARENEELFNDKWLKKLEKMELPERKAIEEITSEGIIAKSDFKYQGKLQKKGEYVNIRIQDMQLLKSKGCI